MNKKERALLAMEGKKVDRVPVMLYRHFKTQDSDNSVEEYVDWARRSNIDMLLIQVDGYDGLPIENVTGTIEDLKNLKPLDRNYPFIAGQVDRAKRISEKLKGEIAVFPVMYTPFNNLKKACKYQFKGALDINDLWLNERELVKDVMKYAEEANTLLLDAYKNETDVDGVMISFRNAGEDRIATEEYRSELLPFDERELAYANEKFDHNIVHICGWYGANDVEIWRNCDYKTVNWDIHVEHNPINGAPLDICSAREVFKSGTVLMCGFNNRDGGLIYAGTKEEVQQYVKWLINTAQNKDFILGADCSIKHTIPDERIHWIVEACEQAAKN